MKDKANRFWQLHQGEDIFVMANAWNAGSAVLLEQAGFDAIGTTSAGIAYGHAVPDSSGELSFDTALEATREIAGAVKIPVSMDAENAYADSLEAVYENMQRIAASGVVGASIEDYSGIKGDPLYDIELAVDRVRSAVEAVAGLDYPFTLTARAECFLIGHGDALNESIRRVNRYREAGADCLYVPGIGDIDTIKTLVNEVDGPINVVMGLVGTPISVAQLRDAGVTRISIGGSLARATFGLVRRAAKQMLEQGSFEFSKQQIADAELCELFAKTNPR